MRLYLTLFFFFMANTSLRSSTIFVGVDSERLVIWEYWKVENGIPSNEILIYNPTDRVINIEFKKYHYKKQCWLKRLFSRNSLFKLKEFQPRTYILIKDLRSKMRGYSKSFDVYINGIDIGSYIFNDNAKPPISKIQNGIIINQQMNTGRNLLHETVYKRLVFDQASEIQAEILYYGSGREYYDLWVKKAGFLTKNYFNQDSIRVEVLSSKNLLIEEDEEFKLKVSITGKTGELTLKFKNIESDVRFAQTLSYSLTNFSLEEIEQFYIPFYFDFKNREYYSQSDN